MIQQNDDRMFQTAGVFWAYHATLIDLANELEGKVAKIWAGAEVPDAVRPEFLQGAIVAAGNYAGEIGERLNKLSERRESEGGDAS